MPRKLFRCSADSAPRVSAPLVAGAAPFTCDGDADMWVGFCATTAAVAAKSSSVVSCDTFVIVSSSVRLTANGIAASRGKTAQAARRSHAEQTRRFSLMRRVSRVTECRCYCVRVPPMRVGTSAGVVKLTDQRSEEALSGVLEYQPNRWLSLYAIPAVLHLSDNVNGRPVSSSGLGDLPLVVAASYASPTPG